MTGDIPVIQSDRGGQVTYHGPGQQVMYVLLNLKRRKLGVRELVTLLEQTVVNTLAEYGIDAHPRADAPGVYVGEMKICSLGLRIRKGCSFHGLALNINMDLKPFQRINPCGYAGMEMTQMCQWVDTATTENIRPVLLANMLALLNNPRTNIHLIYYTSWLDNLTGHDLIAAFTLYNNPQILYFRSARILPIHII